MGRRPAKLHEKWWGMLQLASRPEGRPCLHAGGFSPLSMSQANVDLIQSLYAAFARADGPAVLASMDPAIVWNEAENFPYADRNPYVGHAAVAEGIFFRLATEWDRFAPYVASYLCDSRRLRRPLAGP
jgi:hypothetical protein